MSSADEPVSSRELRLETVLAELLREEAGGRIDREAILAQHPDLADELRSFFRNRAAVDRFAKPLESGEMPTVGMTPAAAPDGHRPRIRYFGDYELLAEIARGGMGIVYKARQVSLNRTVALKMILSGLLASVDDIRRFRQEAEAAANLDHPHIVPIYEVGEHEGQYYFSMKLIEGGSLTKAIRTGRLQPRQGAALMATIARAVHHAHQRGLLHRDLKPGNILLDAEGRPHVTDFGLARRLEGESDITLSGAIVGTPSYMAPEQAAAEKDLTTAADIYSLGAVMYELLAGRPPYCGTSVADTLVQLATTEPPRPSAFNRHLDRDLETICLKCLEHDPRRRYDSAAALAEDLERWSRNEPVLARPTSLGWRVQKWTRRNPIVAALAAAVLAVTIVGLAGVVWQWREALSAQRRAEAAQQLEAAARERAELSRRQAEEAELRERYQREQAQYEAYVAGIAGAAAKLESGEHQAARDLLALCPVAFRNWEHGRLLFLCRTELFSMTTRREALFAEYSSDGRRIVTTDVDYATQIWNAPGGRLLHTIHLGGDAGNYGKPSRFSADGRRVLTALGHKKIGIIDVESGNIVWRHDEPEWSITGLVAAGDGRHIAIGTNDGWLRVFDVDVGQKPLHQWKVNELGGKKSGSGGIYMSPIFPTALLDEGGKVVVVDHTQREAQVWNVASKKVLHTFPKLQDAADAGGYVAISGDGQRLVAALSDHSLGVWNLESGASERVLKGHTDRIRGVAISSDGRLVAAAGSDGTARIWDLTKNEPAITLHGHDGPLNDIAFSPDGRRLVTAGRDRTARVWDATTGRRLLVVHGHSGSIRSARFSPDGANVLTASRDSTAKVSDAERDPGSIVLSANDKEMLLAAFSSDGRHLLTGSTDGKVRLWEASSGKLIHEWSMTHGPTALGFGENGRRAIAVALQGSVHVWNLESGMKVPTINETGSSFVRGCLSADGLRALTYNGKDSPRVINLRDGTQICELKVSDALPEGVNINQMQFAAFSLDARFIVAVAFQAVSADQGDAKLTPKNYPLHVVWDAATGLPLAHFRPKTGALISDQIAFLHDGEHMICADHVVRKITTGEIVRQLPTGDFRGGFAISGDGRAFLQGGTSHQAGIWNVVTGERITTLQGLSEPCRAATFSPDGRRALTTTLDGPTRLWDTKTGRELLTLPGDADRHAQVAFSPDGRQLLMVYGGKVHLLPAVIPPEAK